VWYAAHQSLRVVVKVESYARHKIANADGKLYGQGLSLPVRARQREEVSGALDVE
jgi:hypothetical protein